MARNLGHRISCNLHSLCHAMVLTANFHRDSRVHIFRTDGVVKYIVVYSQIKAAD